MSKLLLDKCRGILLKLGALIVALVLPFRPYVEVNPNNKPSGR